MTEKRPYRVLLALSDDSHLDAWINLVHRLEPDCDDIYLRGMVAVPEEVSLSEGAIPARRWRDSFSRVLEQSLTRKGEARVHVDYCPMARIIDELPSLSVDLCLVQWQGPSEPTGGLSTDDLLQHIGCDLILLHGDTWLQDGPVLLSLRGGPNITLSVSLAKALSRESSITLFHAADHPRRAPALERLMRFDPQINRAVTAVTGITEGILYEAANHKAIILGATFHLPEIHSSLPNPIIRRIYEQTHQSLALVRAWYPEPLPFHAPGQLSRRPDDLSTRVDRWFAENTFDSQEFADLRELLNLKEKQNLTISVGLPALNEEETVGTVIETLKRALMDELPLIDEIVLIDSCSTDNTVAIAQACGIPTCAHPAILPEMGSYEGKGEALWKSLYRLSGDIIVWVDTDITNFHPRFVYGLLGPLLKRPQVQYVKGFYQRPIQVDGKLQAYGGGRVTELVARPLINLFYPELSGIVQPLSGEYAGRRRALEQVPFFSGYGVETGLLIDLLERFGLDAIAQCDLQVRVHHNQPLVGLSKMAFAIMQVFMARLEGRYNAPLLEKANRAMKLIVQEPERFALDSVEIGDAERPAMITLPAYRQRFALN